MPQEEIINLQIPGDKINEFIASKLLELEAQLLLSNYQQKIILAELRKDDPTFEIEKYSKGVEDELRTLRLKLSANFIKQYS
ncbi:MAG: hypothetical protein NTX65_03175 [Ignavibacteriales bacterium]|nr:hypothetical protein [Ignavibacteriales bacterium]